MNRRTVVVALVLAVVLGGGIYFVKKTRSDQSVLTSPQKGEKSKGPANAPVQIIEYSDFQCPACMKAQPIINAILEEYPGKIKFVFQHYPLPMHQWAGLAHQAAECANVQGKFWQFHDKVYQKQPIWSAAANVPELIISYAKDAGVDIDAFGACLSNGDITRKILDERKAGTALRLSSTPTFFINGERVVGQIELENNGRNIIRKILGMPPLPAKTPVPAVPPLLGTPPAQAPSVPALPQIALPVQETSSKKTAQN